MNLRPQKAMAAKVLKVGVSKIWVDPTRLDEVSLAIRRDDIRKLITMGTIKAKPAQGVSRGRARVLHKKKQKGLRKKTGSREGKKYSIVSRKERWMIQIRALRRHLSKLRERKSITPHVYRQLYGLCKGNRLRTRAQIDSYIEVNKLGRK
ncbi:MAG: 50S ribosomal protein L19e [Candidatus Ranarchaeia archaeon]|jgi:large subunit ribosomal protein L19e